MTTHYHAVIWIDHHEARIFHFNATDVDHLVIRPENPTLHIHHKANTIGSGHVALDQKFLHDIANAVSDAGAVLIAGPGSAKTELINYIKRHDLKVLKKVLGVEAVDHPSAPQLVAHARKFFKSADTWQPQ